MAIDYLIRYACDVKVRFGDKELVRLVKSRRRAYAVARMLQ